MNTLRSHEESDPLLSPRSATDPLFHQCPVCGTLHEVNAVRAQFAYGRQLSCSPDCEAERRRRIRAAYRCAPSLVRSEALVESCSVAGPVRAAEKSVPLKLMISEAAHSGASMKQRRGAGSNGAAADGERRVRNSPSQRAHSAALAGEHKAVVSAIVESSDVLQVRRAIFQAGSESVGILKTAPVPHSSKVRVFIGMRRCALDSIMTAIMRSVVTCEFGHVARM